MLMMKKIIILQILAKLWPTDLYYNQAGGVRG